MQPTSPHLFRLTIFLGSFLLFLIQPMIAKMILPWFGGTAAVWTACMMFFQVMLVLGYAYAHFVRRWLPIKLAFYIHAILLLAAILFLPIIPDISLRPASGQSINQSVALTLLMTVGMPYFVLAANSTLIQIWHEAFVNSTSPDSPVESKPSTYRLYAVSNLGSMLALLCYPFIIEPYATLTTQAWIWSAGFVAYAVVCIATAFQTRNLTAWRNEIADEPTSKVTGGRILLWFLLSAIASINLLATTNLMCQEIASAPFLWILPLAVYLMSFIICFERPRIYNRAVFIPLLCISVLLGIGVVQAHIYLSILIQIAVMTSVCFFVSMACHGELERSKPSTAKLTSFYLTIAIGGAAGGIFTAIAAPIIFDSFLEFQIGILGCLGLVVLRIYQSNLKIGKYIAILGCGLAGAVTLASLMLQINLQLEKETVITRQRNEYGIVTVTENEHYRRFVSGNVDHGGQNLDPEMAFEPSSYYTTNSGVGIAFRRMREFSNSQNRPDGIRTAVVGMGIGAMLAWCEPEDHFTFYEINPIVDDIARQHFSFLDKFKLQTKVLIGDGRILLERSLNETGDKLFDLIIVDAFSSDAIPQHLLTTQCIDLYLEKLVDDGMLIFHITNRFVDLRPVIAAAAAEKNLFSFVRENKNSQEDKGTLWVCLSRRPDLLSAEWMKPLESSWPKNMPSIQWTDDFAPLAPVTIWNTGIDVDALKSSQTQSPLPKPITEPLTHDSEDISIEQQ